MRAVAQRLEEAMRLIEPPEFVTEKLQQLTAHAARTANEAEQLERRAKQLRGALNGTVAPGVPPEKQTARGIQEHMRACQAELDELIASSWPYDPKRQPGSGKLAAAKSRAAAAASTLQRAKEAAAELNKLLSIPTLLNDIDARVRTCVEQKAASIRTSGIEGGPLDIQPSAQSALQLLCAYDPDWVVKQAIADVTRQAKQQMPPAQRAARIRELEQEIEDLGVRPRKQQKEKAA
jgi:hypothetical protein